MEYPKTLYVKKTQIYPYMGVEELLGKSTLEAVVPDNEKENEIAVYQLVSVNNYKKIVTTVVEEVKPNTF